MVVVLFRIASTLWIRASDSCDVVLANALQSSSTVVMVDLEHDLIYMSQLRHPLIHNKRLLTSILKYVVDALRSPCKRAYSRHTTRRRSGYASLLGWLAVSITDVTFYEVAAVPHYNKLIH